MPIKMTVVRSERTIELSGTFEPDVIEATAEPMFRHTARSGRVDLVRRGNTIDAKTRGVTHFTLLLSPDQCDFAQPIHVTVNGRPVFDGLVAKSLATLMKWAARDNDRTMLFGAEVPVSVK